MWQSCGEPRSGLAVMNYALRLRRFGATEGNGTRLLVPFGTGRVLRRHLRYFEFSKTKFISPVTFPLQLPERQSVRVAAGLLSGGRGSSAAAERVSLAPGSVVCFPSSQVLLGHVGLPPGGVLQSLEIVLVVTTRRRAPGIL